MGRRTVLAEYLVFSVAVLSSVGGCFAIPSQHSSIGSFRGGFRQVDLELKEGASLTVELSFRTASYDSGLLFLVAQRNHSGYLAAGLKGGALEIVLKRNDDGQTPPQVLHSFDFILHNTSIHPSDWHSISVQYDQSPQLLSVTLDNSIIHSQTLTLGEAFSSVFFSGMDSFLSHRLFHNLPLASFFIGCLANVSVDSMPVVFVPDHQNGIELGCCLIPRRPSWCFQSSHSNLSIPTPLYHNGSLLISFNLEFSAGGLVLFTQAEPSQSLQLYLSGHNLSLVILSSQENNPTETLLNCPELPSAGEVHSVEITLTSESIHCSVGGGTANDMQLSTELSLMFTDLILGSADVHGVRHPSFEGCIQHFKLNGAEVMPSLGGNLLIQPPPRWEELTFDLHPLIVDEGERVRLSEQNVRITFPEEFFADDFTITYQQDIERALHIRLVEGPYQGHLVQGSSGNAVSEFTYNALTSQDNETQIFYRHSEISLGNVTDEIVIKLSVECGGSAAAAHQVLFNGTLEITIIESIDIPLEVEQNDAMSIAAGTRRVITSNHLTVTRRMSPIDVHVPSEITFALQSIELVACDGTSCNEESGKLVKTYNPNLPVIYFSQQEIDEGRISFQHYERFGVEPVVIQLLASTNGGSINVTIDVHPYKGRIDYLSRPGTCLFVKEGSTAVVEPKHLNTTTNFEDQDPTVNYDIIVEPMYGYFERFITYHNITPDWHPLTSVAPSTSGSQISDVQHFTQEDVDNGHVRYIHNHSSILTQESVQFRLRSSNLTGDLETLCIQIVPTAILLDSHISIVAQQIRVDESGSVQINRGLLTTTSSRTEDAFNGVVSIEQMGIVYILEAVPSHGSLLISQRELGIGDNFTFDEVSSGLLSYEHRGTEDHSDSFRIYAVATTTATLLIKSPDPSPVVTVNIAINPINNHLPVLSDNLEPINPPEGGFIVITENHIQVTDEDRPHEVLTIFIRRRGETHIGFFALRDASDKPVSRFTMHDVRERRVIYQHRLNTSAPLTQTQIVRLDDGLKDHYVRGPIRIVAKPWNLTVEISGSNCLANIDAATPDQLTVTIDYSMFSIMLEDHLGQDGNLVHEIDVFVAPPPRYGQFNNRVRGTRNITTFKLVELEQREIEYQFANQTTTTDSDSFSWEFRYGRSVEGPFPFQICIIPVPIPEIIHVGIASVAFGGMVNLDSSHLLAIDNRGGQGMNDSLEYRILTPPQNGTLMKRDTPNIVKFTQTDVNDRRVLYQSRHADTHSTMQDRFMFEVCTTYRCTEPETFVININRNNITVVNTGFEVEEGSMHRITTNELNILAPKDSIGLRFFVEQQPEHGNITLRTGVKVVNKVRFFDLADVKTGSIFYQNDGNEFLHDSFEFTATAQYPNKVTGKLETLQFSDMANITILPVNDNPPEIVRSLENYDVVKGGSTKIPGSLLSAHDYDSDMHDDDIIWQLEFGSPYNGYMFLDKDRGRMHAISNWTEGDLRRNRLYYRNDDGSNLDIILFTLSDGFHTSVGDQDDQRIFLNLQEIIFESTATVNHPLRVTEGESVTITTDYLSYRASNDNSLGDEDFIYTLDIQPNHGSLVFNGTVLQTEMSFSQQSLRTGSLVYIHDHSNNKTDSFQYKLEVVDRTGEDSTGNLFEFQIAIDTVDDDPPEVTIIPDPLFVVELSHVQINGSALVIYDLDADNDVEYDEIVCTLETEPSYGLLSRDRFGKKEIHTREFTKLDIERNHLVYNHTTLGHYEDRFTFKVTDGINPQNETYEVNIVILPEEVSVRVSNISVDEGQREYLEREDFVIDHPYLNTVAGRFSVIRHPTSGVLINRNSTEKVVRTFTVDDLDDELIVYQHNGNGEEIISDSFEFFYESLKPDGLQRRSLSKTVHINIKPVDDEPPIFGKSEKRADIISGSEILLNERYLNVTDGDTPPEQLKYNFTVNIRGYIVYTNDTKQRIREFTHADVMAGRVKFIHEMDLTGNINFTVTDGKQKASTTLDITATELEIDCNEERWSEVSVTAGGEVRITNDHINCRILYDRMVPITFVMNRPPQRGHFMVDEERRNRFTMAEVNENKVTYVHTDFEFWEEEERLNVSAVANYVEPFLCDKLIHIRFPQSNTHSRFAVNEGLQLEEGGMACLNETNLDVRNLRYRAWLANRTVAPRPNDLVPVFDVTDGPRNGTLFLLDSPSTPVVNFTYTNVSQRGVCYQHSDEEKFEDSIHIRLHFVPMENLAASLVFTGNLSYLSGISDIIAINITPVNDQRPIVKTNRNLALVLNFTHRITADDLCVEDLDSPPENVIFTLLSPPPSGAKLLLNDQDLTIGNNFTQADIFNDRLKIEPVSETTEQQSFILSYEDEIAVKNEVYIRFNVSGHYLRILHAGEVTYQQNAKRILIGRDNLDTETNGDFRDTVFKVRSGPEIGQLRVGEERAAQQFTQIDINEGRVIYIPPSTDTSDYSDSISLIVTNHNQRKVVNLTFTSLVWGTVRKDATINLTSSLSQPLPRDLLKLGPDKPPEIKVIQRPTYGRLEFITEVGEGVGWRGDMFTFHYDDLIRGWVSYRWDYTQRVSGVELIDNFTLLVVAEGMQPGKATVSLKVYPPKDYQPSSTTLPGVVVRTDPPRMPDQAPHTDNDEQGFPLYTLVPILGIFVILLIIIAVIILFCTTQQSRIRKKVNIGIARPPPVSVRVRRCYPWSVDSHAPPSTQAMAPPNYSFDPTSHSGDESVDNEEHNNSETSSGFSEPSPRHSPVQQRAFSIPVHRSQQLISSQSSANHIAAAAAYGRGTTTPSLAPPRARSRASNVSITFSSRQSMAASDVNIEDSASHFYCHSLPGPQQHGVVIPTPMRPASHSAFSRVPRPLPPMESGYNSEMFPHGAGDSGVLSRAGSCGEYDEDYDLPDFPSADVDVPLPASLNDRLSGSIVVPSCRVDGDAGPGPMELGKSSLAIGEDFLDLNDPNVLQRLRSPNPVLRKEEYWV